MPASNVTMRDIYLARRRIASIGYAQDRSIGGVYPERSRGTQDRSIARRTPLVHSPLLTERLGSSDFGETSASSVEPSSRLPEA
jgi:hypothetical protein